MLSLVKVYGTVLREVDSVPEVQAEYVRNWDWGAFAFMSYGKQKGSSEWKKRAKFGGNRVYTACPTAKYYEERLGTRESQQ